jgi:hypothetical protein
MKQPPEHRVWINREKARYLNRPGFLGGFID